MSSSKGFHTTKICLNNIKKTYKRDTQHKKNIKKKGRQNEPTVNSNYQPSGLIKQKNITRYQK